MNEHNNRDYPRGYTPHVPAPTCLDRGLVWRQANDNLVRIARALDMTCTADQVLCTWEEYMVLMTLHREGC